MNNIAQIILISLVGIAVIEYTSNLQARLRCIGNARTIEIAKECKVCEEVGYLDE